MCSLNKFGKHQLIPEGRSLPWKGRLELPFIAPDFGCSPDRLQNYLAHLVRSSEASTIIFLPAFGSWFLRGSQIWRPWVYQSELCQKVEVVPISQHCLGCLARDLDLMIQSTKTQPDFSIFVKMNILEETFCFTHFGMAEITLNKSYLFYLSIWKKLPRRICTLELVNFNVFPLNIVSRMWL